MAMVVLCGLHAVALAAILTVAAHKLKWKTLDRNQLVASIVVASAAFVAAVAVDVQRAHRVFGIGVGTYVGWVVAVVLVTNAVTLNYLHPRFNRAQLPSLSAVVGFGATAGGAAVLIVTLLLTAYWRNTDPVAGPAIEDLPEIPAISGDYVALGDSY